MLACPMPRTLGSGVASWTFEVEAWKGLGFTTGFMRTSKRFRWRLRDSKWEEKRKKGGECLSIYSCVVIPWLRQFTKEHIWLGSCLEFQRVSPWPSWLPANRSWELSLYLQVKHSVREREIERPGQVWASETSKCPPPWHTFSYKTPLNHSQTVPPTARVILVQTTTKVFHF